MKKFSRMPKSEGSGGSGTACVGSGGGGSGVALGKVFAVGRYQVTPEELLAEGNAGTRALPCGVPVEQGESGSGGGRARPWGEAGGAALLRAALARAAGRAAAFVASRSLFPSLNKPL